MKRALALLALCFAGAPLVDCGGSGATDIGTQSDLSVTAADQGVFQDAATKDSATDSGPSAHDGGVVDPTQAGPFAYQELDATFTSTVDSSSIAVHVAYPTSGPKAGPYPVIMFARGFLIDPSEYYSYVQRAASFGYVGMTVKFRTSTTSANYVDDVTDFLGGLDWLAAQNSGGASPLAGLVNTNLVGTSGHSLGGKIAVLAAARDTRIKAVIAFDAVDGSNNCEADGDCPDAASVLPLPIPTAFLGETLDSQPAFGFGQACAPAATDYTTLYAPASSPSIQVTLTGAGHVSFLDSVSACGLFCTFCATPVAPQAQVLNVAHSYLVSFFERYLRNDTAYDTYLTGAQAQALFVATQYATIAAK